MKWKSGVEDKTCLIKQLGSVASYKGTAFHEMVGQYMRNENVCSLDKSALIMEMVSFEMFLSE